MKLNELQPAPGSRKSRKRIGRGQGSGQGGTAGKGHKGQNARSGGGVRMGFEGGQMPLQRRLPKRGFYNKFALKVMEVNLRDLNRFEAGTVVDAQALAEAGLVKGAFDQIKILGHGELSRALTLKVDRISAGAKAKVEAAGGSVELI
jgi:large subunit ribosomal protein L15